MEAGARGSIATVGRQVIMASKADELLPTWDVGGEHKIEVHAPPAVVYEKVPYPSIWVGLGAFASSSGFEASLKMPSR